MSRYTRWLAWEQSPENNGKCADDSPTKPSKPRLAGSVGATPWQTPYAFPLEAEPAAYEEACDRWLLERCVVRDRVWSGVGSLHGDYCAWCAHTAGEVPASRRLFRSLLVEAGFTTTENEMVYGLLLIEEVSQRIW